MELPPVSPKLRLCVIFPVIFQGVFLALGFSTPTLVYKEFLWPDRIGFSSALYGSDCCVPNWTQTLMFSNGNLF